MQEVLEKKSIKNIDFNCDLAQAYGVYKNENETALTDFVSSVNISSGFHAGDPMSIKSALMLAKEKNLAVGAHIGFNDIQGFGYRLVELKDEEIETIVIYQVGAIMEFAKAYGLSIEHVRPHGAMYKMAGENYDFSLAVAKAIKKCSDWLIYYAPAGEISERVSEDAGIQIAREICLEKSYNSDLTIDYSADDNTNNYELIKNFQQLIHTSRLKNNLGGTTFAEVDTIHFSNKYKNSLELIEQAYGIIKPSPVNYNNAKISGWVD